LFSVRDALGEISGYYRWEEHKVFYQPQPELIPGRRYVFSFEGMYYDPSGVEYFAHTIVPFYYTQRDGSAPYVVSSNPDSGQTLAPDDEIHIWFSEGIDESSLAKALVIQPDTAVTTDWQNEGTELVLTAQEGWKHCHSYTIRITEELRATSGVPLAEVRELVFRIQGDIETPRIIMVEPGMNQPAHLYPAVGYGLMESIALTDVLRIRFSEEMDTRETTNALIIHPAVAQQCVWIDASLLVVAPTNGFAADTEYLLAFDAQAVDRAGNAIAMEEPIRFVTIPGTIEVVTEFVQDGFRVEPGDYSTVTATEIQPYPISSASDYELLFHFTGARFDSNSEKYTAQEAISLICVFPDSGVATPIATGFSWMGDLILGVTYSELQPSTATQRVYYLLCIRGGPGGIATDDGFRLQRDLEHLLVTAVE
jgi:hypothetical protein